MKLYIALLASALATTKADCVDIAGYMPGTQVRLSCFSLAMTYVLLVSLTQLNISQIMSTSRWATTVRLTLIKPPLKPNIADDSREGETPFTTTTLSRDKTNDSSDFDEDEQLSTPLPP